MEIIKYLNACVTDHPYDTLAELKEELGIKHSHDERFPELYVLNYDQIESPKHHPITLECRSLVLEFVEMGNWKVVSRSFDRFFNYGETEAAYNASELTANEKMDGSLIGIFYHDKYGWLYRTRSMIMPTSSIMGFELTWDDLIEEALGEHWSDMAETFKHDVMFANSEATYICEVTSPENRVVTRYEGREMTLLSARRNSDGAYWDHAFLDDLAIMWGWRRPQRWKFETMADCAQGAKDLRELNEGYVMYSRMGEPACKVKNPAYVAAHHLRGEGQLTPKRVMDLIIINELDEYLSIFPEDADQVAPYQLAMHDLWMHAHDLWVLHGDVTDQKEFALCVKDSPVATLLFRRKGGVSFSDAWNNLTNNAKYAMISKYVEMEKNDGH